MGCARRRQTNFSGEKKLQKDAGDTETGNGRRREEGRRGLVLKKNLGGVGTGELDVIKDEAKGRKIQLSKKN